MSTPQLCSGRLAESSDIDSEAESLNSTGDNRRIVPAEAKAVAHHPLNLDFLWGIWRVVEIAIWIGRIQIDRRRSRLVLEGQQRDN